MKTKKTPKTRKKPGHFVEYHEYQLDYNVLFNFCIYESCH